MEAAIYRANKLKQKGTRVLGVGVDLDQLPPRSMRNLAAISGPVLNQDYYRGSWDQLQTQLKAAVTDATACVANVVVKKCAADPDGRMCTEDGVERQHDAALRILSDTPAKQQPDHRG